MLSQFPAGEGDRLATESFVRTEFTGLRPETVHGFSDLKDHVHRELRQYLVPFLVWSYGAMFLLLAAVVTAAKILE